MNDIAQGLKKNHGDSNRIFTTTLICIISTYVCFSCNDLIAVSLLPLVGETTLSLVSQALCECT